MPPAAGTVNITYNTAQSERDVLGRWACRNDVSIGELIRNLLLLGAKDLDPELAARLKAARKQRFASAAAIALCCWIHVSSVAGDDEMLRPGRVGKVCRTAYSLRINRSQYFKLAA